MKKCYNLVSRMRIKKEILSTVYSILIFAHKFVLNFDIFIAMRSVRYTKNIIIAASVILLFFLSASGCKKQTKDTDEETFNNRRIRYVLISYMSEPGFRNTDFYSRLPALQRS
jgi:hypothetical protein